MTTNKNPTAAKPKPRNKTWAQTGATPARVEDIRGKAIEMLLAGHKFPAIGEALGISRQRACVLAKEALEDLKAETLEDAVTCRALAKQYKVPLNADGSSKLSNAEWTRIKPFMNHGRKRFRSFKLSQRGILDGVLNKLATGTPWKQVNYEVGSWQNASAAFQSWSTRGTMNLIIQTLHDIRTAQS